MKNQLVSKQPTGEAMDIYKDYSEEDLLEPSQFSVDLGLHPHGRRCCGRRQRRCRTNRQRFLFVFLALLLLLALLLTWYCTQHLEWNGTAMFNGLVKRAPGEPTGDSGNGPFLDRHYYLIVVFVGLFLVVIAAIMLSAWCCRGAFQNPLCCPCYLCACCGGLACLECLACGLCCEGVSSLEP